MYQNSGSATFFVDIFKGEGVGWTRGYAHAAGSATTDLQARRAWGGRKLVSYFRLDSEACEGSAQLRTLVAGNIHGQ
ncbi:hypothetical protein [Actinomyces sp.]|uniref:hypothetical protein n=1 Tax=Actinomyces sp. TaxID=29317 RepID=UPI0029119010|nr:hypothetical protein [Actinomyces sp.]MDU5230722.1 hypothetical protein [Actinomyces sp.]MDU6756155.1 hypothetical protein [Actinomyces sp.]